MERATAHYNRDGRVFGILGLALQLALLFVYGFNSEFYDEGSAGAELATRYMIVYDMLPLLFALLGFGLLLSQFKWAAWTGLATALLVVAVHLQLSYLMQKLWYNVFVGDFSSDNCAASSDGADPIFTSHQQKYKITPSVYTLKLAIACSVAQLVSMLGVLGRLPLFETLYITLLSNLGWHLSFYACVGVNRLHSLPAIFDSYGTDTVYLFGACFGAAMIAMLQFRPSYSDVAAFTQNRVSSVMALAGTAFVFATFASTGPTYPFDDSKQQYSLGAFNMFFALVSSVMGCYATSAILNKGRVGIHEAFLGTVSGGVMCGAVAHLLPNIGAAFAVGGSAGVVSGLWFSLVHPRLNSRYAVDSMGMMGGFLIPAVLGGVVVAPIVVATSSAAWTQGATSPSSDALYMLAYAGIAAACGLGFGVLAGLVAMLCRRDELDFEDSIWFTEDYGLNPDPEHEEEER